MATKTPKYELQKKEDNDFYDIEDLNANWDKVEKALTEFDDSGTAAGITSFTDMLTKFVTGNKLAVTLRNLKAGLQFVLHAGSIVNNCVTDNAGLPLSAAQGKVLMDKYTQLYSDLSNALQYMHTASNPFDFDDPTTPAGFHRLSNTDSFKNSPIGIKIVYGNVIVSKVSNNDTTSMFVLPYDSSVVIFKSGSTTSWGKNRWKTLVSKDELNHMVNWTTPEASKYITLAYDFNTNKIGVWKDNTFIREI